MKQRDAINQILKDNGKSKGWLAEKMGYRGVNAISQMLKRGNVTVDTLYQICQLLDYEITIQPQRKPGARPVGQILIEGRERDAVRLSSSIDEGTKPGKTD